MNGNAAGQRNDGKLGGVARVHILRRRIGKSQRRLGIGHIGEVGDCLKRRSGGAVGAGESDVGHIRAQKGRNTAHGDIGVERGRRHGVLHGQRQLVVGVVQ